MVWVFVGYYWEGGVGMDCGGEGEGEGDGFVVFEVGGVYWVGELGCGGYWVGCCVGWV